MMQMDSLPTKEGLLYHVVSMKWWSRWKTYTNYKEANKACSSEEESTKVEESDINMNKY